MLKLPVNFVNSIGINMEIELFSEFTAVSEKGKKKKILCSVWKHGERENIG